MFENKKGFESSKEDIRNIINESTFEIYDDKEKNKKNIYSTESRYNCRCIYKEKTQQKFLKELCVLQQLASLSQNKEKEDENKILNIFIELIENIKEIISIIEKIIYKGFPEEFYYRINLKEGNAICKNMNIKSTQSKNLLQEKTFLKKLLKSIKKSQILAYKEKKFLKFFFGQQLTLFNNYLKNKIGKSSLKNEATNLIFYIIGNKFKKNHDNFIYKTSHSSPIEFNYNTESNEGQLILHKNTLVPRLNKDNNIIEKLDIGTKFHEDASYENIFSYKDGKKKGKIPTNITTLNYLKENNNPLMEQGSEQELEALIKDMYEMLRIF